MFIQPGTPSLAYFENYKMDILKTSKCDDQKPGSNWIPDDQTLKAMYEAARVDKISQANHFSMRSIMVNILILLISIGLFIVHWVWMKRLSRIAVS